MGDKKVGLNPGTMVQVSPGNFVPASDIRQINVVGQRPGGVSGPGAAFIGMGAPSADNFSVFDTLGPPSIFENVPLSDIPFDAMTPEQQAAALAAAEEEEKSGFNLNPFAYAEAIDALGMGDASTVAFNQALAFDAMNLAEQNANQTGFQNLHGSGEGETFTPASFEGVYDAAAGGFEIDGVFYRYGGVSSPGPDGQPINVVDGGTYKLVTQQDGSVSVEAVVPGENRNTDALPKVDGDYSFDDIMTVVGLIRDNVYTPQQIADIYGVSVPEVQGIVDNPPSPPGTDPGAGAGTTPGAGTLPGTDPGAGTTPGGDGTGAITVDPYTGPFVGPLPPGGGGNDELNGETDSAENDGLDVNLIPGLIAGTLLPKDDDPDPDPDPVAQPPLPVPVGGVPADPGFVTRDDVLVEFDTPDYDPYSILPAPTTEPFLADRRAGDIASSLDVLGYRPAQGLDQRPETMARVEDYAQRFGVGPQDFSQGEITPFETQFGINIPNVSTNFPVRPQSILETPRFDPTKPRDIEDDGDMRLFAGGGVAESSDGIGSLMKRRESAVTRMLLNKAGALPTYQDGGKVTVENDDRNRVTSLLKSTTEVPAGLRDAAGYAYDYLTETPVSEMMGDVREMGAGMVRSAIDDPVDFALDFVPGVSQARGLADYEEMMSQAELARVMGDEETADALRAMASSMLASSMIPGGRKATKMGMSGDRPSFEEMMELIRQAKEQGEKTLKDLRTARKTLEESSKPKKGIESLEEKIERLRQRSAQQTGRTRGQIIEESPNITRVNKRGDPYDPEE